MRTWSLSQAKFELLRVSSTSAKTDWHRRQTSTIQSIGSIDGQRRPCLLRWFFAQWVWILKSFQYLRIILCAFLTWWSYRYVSEEIIPDGASLYYPWSSLFRDERWNGWKMIGEQQVHTDDGDCRRGPSDHFEENKWDRAIDWIAIWSSTERFIFKPRSLIKHTNNWFAAIDVGLAFLFKITKLDRKQSALSAPSSRSYLINLIIEINESI